MGIAAGNPFKALAASLGHRAAGVRAPKMSAAVIPTKKDRREYMYRYMKPGKGSMTPRATVLCKQRTRIGG